MSHLRNFFFALLAITAVQTAWAGNIWNILSKHDTSTRVTTFTVIRKDSTYAETVLYRTVGITAYPGQNYTAVSGSLNFGVNEGRKVVTVTEKAPANSAYWFQSTGVYRNYKLEVTDRAGFLLKSDSRSLPTGTGTQLSDAYMNKSISALTYFYKDGDGSLLSNTDKYLDVAHTGSAGTWVKVTDAGYKQAVYTMNTDALYSNSSAIRTFLNNQGDKMYATVYFTQKEENDGYQYIQILADNASSYDANDPQGSVNDPSTSLYKACFILSYTPSGSVETTPHTQFFPHRWDYEDRDAQYKGNSWLLQEFDGDNVHLYGQSFKTATPSYRAENSGSLVLTPSVSNINVRFDAAGSGDDNWYFKDMKLRLAIVDATAPTVLARTVAPGRHAKGNTLYLSVAFSEPVTITGDTKKLITNWGDLTYVSGSGTNVLTFSGMIIGTASTSLSITDLNGAIADFAGNYLSGSVNADNLCSLDANDLSLLSQDGDGNYLIASTGDLQTLSSYVNDGHTCSGLIFLQTADIAFSHTTNWNSSSSTENNFIAIGNYNNFFNATYDGNGHTISGIRIYKDGADNADGLQGLFGYVRNGVIRNVHLTDARITGYYQVGGIVGCLEGSYAKVMDCSVAADVCIHAVQNSYHHGGVVGYNYQSGIYRCISRATLTAKSGKTHKKFGGITGYTYSYAHIADCLAEGVSIPNIETRGAIIGYNEDNTTYLLRNYYRECKVASSNVTPSGVGQGIVYSTATSDVEGVQPLYALTLGAHIAVDRTPSATLPKNAGITHPDGATLGGNEYYVSGASVPLIFTIPLPAEADLSYSATAGTIEDSTLAMPAAATTVNANISIPYIDADGAKLNCTDFTFITSSDADVTLGTGGQTNWYVVSGNVTINGQLCFNNTNTHLIVCDGASLTITNSGEALYCPNGSLTVYGQTLSNGTISATSTDYLNGKGVNIQQDIIINGGSMIATGRTGLYISHSATINRGTVTATGNNNYAIYAYYPITINGGTVTASGSNYGLYTGSDMIINGGTVNATGGSKYGIYGNHTIRLGWSNPDDRITANSYAVNSTYGKAIYVKEGQALTDSTNIYTDTLSAEQIAAIAGKTLLPVASYSITYDLAGGSVATPNPDNYTIESADITLVNPTRDGYTFIGWTGTELSAATETVTIASGSIGDRTYTANWELITYSITCDLAGGSVATANPDNYTIESADITLVNPTRDGCTFIGWTGTELSAATETVTIASGSIGDRTYTANWELITYSITYDLAGGAVVTANPDNYTVESADITLVNPTREGYAFCGWTGTGLSAATETVTITTGSFGDRTYTANWKTAIPYIDADGNEQLCADFTVVDSSYDFGDYGSAPLGIDDYIERWYVIVGTVNVNKPLAICGNTRLILSDGAALNVDADNSSGDAFYSSYDGSLTIYGQAQGTGTLSVTNTGEAITVNNNIIVNGGIIVATSTGNSVGIHIYEGGILTVNRGTVTATGGYGISVHNATLTINGGSVMATGSGSYRAGIEASGGMDPIINILGGTVTTIGTNGASGIMISESAVATLGWTNPTDRISATDIYVDTYSLRVRDGQALSDGTNVYTGILSSTQRDALAKKTLQPCYAVTFDANGGSDVASRPALFDTTGKAYVSAPDDPTREGYSFVQWLNGTEAFDFATEVTNHLTLTAEWQESTPTGVENQMTNGQWEMTNHKYLMDGRVVIVRNGVKYNVAGQKIK